MKRTITAVILAGAALTACGTNAVHTVTYTPEAPITAPTDVPVASAGPVYVSVPTVTAHPRPTTIQTPAPVVTRKPRPTRSPVVIMQSVPPRNPPGVLTPNPRPVNPDYTPTPTTAPSSDAPHIDRGERTVNPTPVVVTPCPEEDPESCTTQP